MEFAPVISVVIPSYNHANYLKQRIESVINQTYTNFEIIILDDASTDSSKTIIDNYKTNKKVTHVIYNPTNSGSPFLQWKKGLELATGIYVWIAESDDTSRLDFLETLVTILEKNPELTLVYSDSESDDFGWRIVEQKHNIESKLFEGDIFVRQKMLTSPSIVNASAVLFRREAVQKNLLLESNNYKTAFDWLFWCNIAMQGKVAFYPEKLNFFRKHQQNTSLKATEQGLFVSEGLQVIAYLKKKYNIKLNVAQCKTWASVWAQTCLLLTRKRSMFLQSRKQVWFVSPKIFIYFIYYLLKFRFFSSPNIQIQKPL
ncbi:glycosyltransferase family 2 protein [Mucilaginibacter sp.]|uniref:glycosyltransferase family 2 protein n=1 Tax=Mucilaginibacter sp. TaxID=1882438 RepID=UPI003B009FAB